MTQEVRIRSITELMASNEPRERSIARATALLYQLMDAVSETGKGGEMTLKFSVKPDKNYEGALEIKATSKITKLPEPEGRASMVYFDRETKTISKTDPRQLELLAEKEAEREEREERARAMTEANITQIGRGSSPA